ncbi:MAG: hypothetical protein V3U51_04230 [Thermoplasmata archaeon]
MKVRPNAYLATAFIVALLPVFLIIPIWVNYDVLLTEGHAHGGEEVDIEELREQTLMYIKRNELPDGTVEGVLMPDANYIMASQFSWTPGTVRMQVGETYMFIAFTVDVVHGFSFNLGDSSFNLVLVPGSPATIHITPSQPGEYLLLCNEYCGAGHDYMFTIFIVE